MDDLLTSMVHRFIDPKPEAVEEFNAYADEVMQTLVWSGGCRS